MALDPDVELLPEMPVLRAEDDLLARGPVAERLVELACAQPLAAPRAIALVGPAGSGKTSVLNLAAALLAARTDAALVTLDGAADNDDAPLIAALLGHLQAFFSSAGVVDTTDAVRDTLARYGELVSGVARIAGVKVDIAGTLRRSTDSMLTEFAEMTQEVGKRVVVALDHVDRMPPRELAATLEALRHYAAIPYVSIVLTLDRHIATLRLEKVGDYDPAVLERLIQVELALPPPDRVLLARVLAGGLARAGARIGRDIDAALDLFDPDAVDGGLGLALIETARDAKRAVNALAAALPLVPADADVREACLDLMLRLLVPEVDTARLDERRRLAGRPDALAALAADLAEPLAGHRRAAAARAALRALCGVG
jgi:hypothetical protein